MSEYRAARFLWHSNRIMRMWKDALSPNESSASPINDHLNPRIPVSRLQDRARRISLSFRRDLVILADQLPEYV
jgi:hypothetical protein